MEGNMHVRSCAHPRPAYDVDVDDDALLERMKLHDDAGAYRLLVERHVNNAYALALRLLRNGAAAEDATQDALIKAWTHRHKWEPGRAQFSTWLYRVVVNRCTDLLRRPAIAGLDDIPEPTDGCPDAATALHRRQVFGQLERAMADLPEQQRTALTLSYFDHLANAEVADIMGTTVTAVESLLKRGRRRLREMLHGTRMDVRAALSDA